MNAYLFSAGITQTQFAPSRSKYGGMALQSIDTCASLIIPGADAAAAQAKLEEALSRPSENENPVQVQIKKLVGVQLINELFTENGAEPLDLKKVRDLWLKTATEETADQFEHGYWVNTNEAVPAEMGKLPLAELKKCVAEDLQTGLNWSPDKQFVFLLTALARWPAAPVEEELEEAETNQGESEEPNEAPARADARLDSSILALPEMREKDAAVIIQARNSAVAAWAWRKFAWKRPELALNEIHVTPLCDMLVS